MTAQDARERAFQLVAREYVADESFFNAGWDAAKREDEQHIEALVAAVQRFKAANDALTRLHEREAIDSTKTDSEWAGLVADTWFEHDRARDAMYVALRALAGSEEHS